MQKISKLERNLHSGNCERSGICGHGRRRICARIVGRSGICEHRRQRYHCKDCGREGTNRGKTNVNINENAINGREVYARIVGEAVSVSMGSGEVYAGIVAEA